ncbi:hypothetical protein TYRP_019867 [Tyrophagus putrescentiae]|nr:hypothetical protein TYRP_019867 [Tyrophagus putrescentiae]
MSAPVSSPSRPSPSASPSSPSTQCVFCGQSVKTALLEDHLKRAHPLRCDICQQTFKHRTSAYRHKKDAHSAEAQRREEERGLSPNKKPFKCFECLKRFQTTQRRDAHHRTPANTPSPILSPLSPQPSLSPEIPIFILHDYPHQVISEINLQQHQQQQQPPDSAASTAQSGTDLASSAIYSPLSEASADDLFLLSQPATTLDTLLTADYNRHLFHHHLTTVLPPPVNEKDLSPLSL